jgi:hypothetical protein
MTTINVLDCDIIYLSYDEPNAEKNYADLLTKVPWAKRIHGVEGSDAAHKACAKISDTERFITVDGDNIIKPDFINQKVEIEDTVDLSKSVISWGAYNIINGLIYGNGGIKCWPKEFVLNMKTHENADPSNIKAQVDFCWDAHYIQQNDCFSEIHNNATPLQAWRAGFREGVKMTLLEGAKLADPGQARKFIHWKNLERLMVWAHVGMDVTNGVWAIYGARHGCYKTNLTDWDYTNVRDFSYLNDLWNNEVVKNIDEYNILDEIQKLGTEITKHMNTPMGNIDETASRFFKLVYRNPARTKVT